MDTIKTLAFYVRVSTEEQAEEGFSIQAQLETLRSYARQHRYIVFKEYIDEGISGKSIDKRFALQQMLEDSKKGLFHEVIVWKINRISRNQLDLLQIVDTLQRNNVTFRSYSENFETETPMGRFALQMMGSVAELERNTIVENVKMGMKQRARQGKWNGGIVLGYQSVEVENSTHRKRKETRLEIVESEAHIVRMIFEKYAGGRGLKSIANELNHLHYKTKHNKPFSVTTVKTILNNPVYIGKIRFNKQENWNDKRRKGTNANPIIVDGEHKAIISQELWDKVQARYANTIRYSTRVFYGSFPFTGVMRCPKCGHGMVSQRATRKNKAGEIKYTLYYQCGQFANKGTAVCRANSVRADYAEQEIMERVQRLLSQPSLITDLTMAINRKRLIDTKPLEQEKSHLNKQIADIDRKKDKYYALYENDMLDPQELKSKLEGLSDMRLQLDTRIAEIAGMLKSTESEPIPETMVIELIHTFSMIFNNISNEKRKQLVHSLIQQITINDDRKIGQVELKFDPSVIESRKRESVNLHFSIAI